MPGGFQRLCREARGVIHGEAKALLSPPIGGIVFEFSPRGDGL